MISFAVRMRFAPEDRANVLTALRTLAQASRQEPGCLFYVPLEVASEPNRIVIFEQYTDESALEAHRCSEHFRKHAIGGLYQWMKERSVEDFNALA